MSVPFMIQSANGALTIDIRHAIYTEGTAIQGPAEVTVNR
jgi:hypothetical protein